jgi:SAM-dependent methyltransferase
LSAVADTQRPVQIRLEEAHCPRCGIPPRELVRRSRSFLDDVPGVYDVRACPTCGMWITSPRPCREDLPLVYPETYPPHRGRQTVERVPAPDSIRGSLLDVGCGNGKYLEVARRDGWRAVGIEVSEAAARVAAGLGFEVIEGDALEVEFPPERFDRVRCGHVLEHVTDPVRLLGRLRDAVKPEGTVEVVIPNPRSLGSLVFRKYWHGLDVPRHLYHYRAEDIRALAGLTGMEVTKIHYLGSPTCVLGSLDRILEGQRRPGARLVHDNPRLRNLVHPFVAVLARIRLSDFVEYRLRSLTAEPSSLVNR